MWCLRCNKQYADGVTVCSVCGGELVDYKPTILSEEERNVLDLEPEQTFNWNENLPNEELAPQSVVTVEDRELAAHYVSLLEEHKIPALIREATDDVAALFAEEEAEQPEAPAVFFEVCVPQIMMQEALEIVMEEDSAEEVIPEEETAKEKEDSLGGWLRRNFSKKK